MQVVKNIPQFYAEPDMIMNRVESLVNRGFLMKEDAELYDYIYIDLFKTTDDDQD